MLVCCTGLHAFPCGCAEPRQPVQLRHLSLARHDALCHIAWNPFASEICPCAGDLNDASSIHCDRCLVAPCLANAMPCNHRYMPLYHAQYSSVVYHCWCSSMILPASCPCSPAKAFFPARLLFFSIPPPIQLCATIQLSPCRTRYPCPFYTCRAA